MQIDDLIRHAATSINSKRAVAGCIGLIVLAAVFFTGLGIGYGIGRFDRALAQPYPTSLAGVDACAQAGMSESATQLCPTFADFWEAMDLLYRDYYGTLPTAQAGTYAAIRGVVDSLHDPHTSFFTPEEAEYFRSNREGDFEGIGARVGWDTAAGTLVITEPFENQPAWLAGLRRGDLVLSVDGVSLAGSTVEDAVKLIRGPQGSTVVLTIRRAGVTAPFDVDVVRDHVEIPTISTGTLGDDGQIAYIRLNSFNEDAGHLVREATRDALQRSPAGLVLDLRGNSGGLLREAIKVANVFLEDATVLSERFSDGKVETYTTTGRALARDIPLVVLVNEGSASASEIVAGALQDAGRGVLVGTTTFGKGSVQLPHELKDGAILRVTVARWYTPKNRSIEGVGLQPDVPVAMTDAQRNAGADPQLDAAIRLLTMTVPQPEP
jgi:carboxyl-terminal processing protease